MLLDIKRAGIEVPLEPKSVKLMVWQDLQALSVCEHISKISLFATHSCTPTSNWISQKLYDIHIDIDGGVTEGEEEVDGRYNRRCNHTNHPRSDGTGRHVP
jgi:hypothetical protein